jgi:hypothetical protein
MLGAMPCSTREVSRAGHSPEDVDALCDGLASPQPRTRYGSAKLLLLLSEQEPALLYPRFDFFARLMEGEARVLRWNATRILGNLARADGDGRIEKLLDGYLAPITGSELIAAANTIQGAAEIARAKPHLADRIAKEILKVSRAHYATPECRNVAAGHAQKGREISEEAGRQIARKRKQETLATAVLFFLLTPRLTPR